MAVFTIVGKRYGYKSIGVNDNFGEIPEIKYVGPEYLYHFAAIYDE